jgi:hypothetical protein
LYHRSYHHFQLDELIFQSQLYNHCHERQSYQVSNHDVKFHLDEDSELPVKNSKDVFIHILTKPNNRTEISAICKKRNNEIIPTFLDHQQDHLVIYYKACSQEEYHCFQREIFVWTYVLQFRFSLVFHFLLLEYSYCHDD